MRSLKEPVPLTVVFASDREQGTGSTHMEMRTMTRLQRLIRNALMRGDRAGWLILRGQEGTPITESEMRALWGDR